MREDHREVLERMFPDGYFLIYTVPDGNLRMNYVNPNGYDLLAYCRDWAVDNLKKEEL